MIVLWRILHLLGLHRNEITDVHVTRHGSIVYNAKCKLCGREQMGFDR